MESLPQDLPFASGSPTAQPLSQAWMQLLDSARESVHVASYYWSLTGPDIGVNDSSSQLVGPWFCFLTVRPGCLSSPGAECSETQASIYTGLSQTQGSIWAGAGGQQDAGWLLGAGEEGLGIEHLVVYGVVYLASSHGSRFGLP